MSATGRSGKGGRATASEEKDRATESWGAHARKRHVIAPVQSAYIRGAYVERVLAGTSEPSLSVDQAEAHCPRRFSRKLARDA